MSYERAKALLGACRDGNINAVEQLIKTGVNINRQGSGDYDRTPLSLATLHQHNKIVKLLLEAGATGKYDEVNKAQEADGDIGFFPQKVEGKKDMHKYSNPLIIAIIQNNDELIQ